MCHIVNLNLHPTSKFKDKYIVYDIFIDILMISKLKHDKGLQVCKINVLSFLSIIEK